MKTYGKNVGFTIVEMTVVVVVIAILAAVAVVGYGSWQRNAAKAELASDLNSAKSVMESARNFNNQFPGSVPPSFESSDGVTLTYVSGNATSYCIEAQSTRGGSTTFYLSSTDATTPKEGSCPAAPAVVTMQTITDANCPTTRTLAADARDNRTYWVQELSDGKCWMLTNLAYAGGGTNTYGDVKTLYAATTSGSYTEARYYTHANANPTADSTSPSTSTDGGATSPQYGYLYNWCAALGAQTGTAACSGSLTPAYNASISACPANWRLPTGNTGGELQALNTAVNGGSTTTSAGLLSNWLGQYGGFFISGPGLLSQGTYGRYWSSTPNIATTSYELYFSASTVTFGVLEKLSASAVRCVAM